MVRRCEATLPAGRHRWNCLAAIGSSRSFLLLSRTAISPFLQNEYVSIEPYIYKLICLIVYHILV